MTDTFVGAWSVRLSHFLDHDITTRGDQAPSSLPYLSRQLPERSKTLLFYEAGSTPMVAIHDSGDRDRPRLLAQYMMMMVMTMKTISTIVVRLKN